MPELAVHITNVSASICLVSTGRNLYTFYFYRQAISTDADCFATNLLELRGRFQLPPGLHPFIFQHCNYKHYFFICKIILIFILIFIFAYTEINN